MNDPKLYLLAIAVHPDDIELGCGGTLIKHARAGDATGILDLTRGELGTRGTPETRLKEAAAAADIMGVRVRENAGMRDGFFRNDEEHQLSIIRFIRRWRPEAVLANALEDRHPDHGRAGRLIADACFLAGLRRVVTTHEDAEQEPWRPKRVFHMIQDRLLEPSFVVALTEEEHRAKMDAVRAYKSQFHDPDSKEPMTYIATQDFVQLIESRDGLMGKRVGAKYGEGFVSENVPGVDALSKLFYPEVV